MTSCITGIIIIRSMTSKIIILFYQVDASLEDAGGYFQHTGESINVLLVNNFAEMEEVRMVIMMILVMIMMGMEEVRMVVMILVMLLVIILVLIMVEMEEVRMVMMMIMVMIIRS